MKVVLVGYNCSGKSFFSERLSSALQIPILHIDDVYYEYCSTHKVERRPEDVKKDVISFIETNDSWVMDGGYDYTGLYECCDAADRIVFMKINRFSRLVNLFKRCNTYKSLLTKAHRVCRSLPWLLHYGCGRKYDASNYASLVSFPDKVVVFRTVPEAQHYFDMLTN